MGSFRLSVLRLFIQVQNITDVEAGTWDVHWHFLKNPAKKNTLWFHGIIVGSFMRGATDRVGN